MAPIKQKTNSKAGKSDDTKKQDKPDKPNKPDVPGKSNKSDESAKSTNPFKSMPEGSTFLFSIEYIKWVENARRDTDGNPPVYWNQFEPRFTIPEEIWRWRDCRFERQGNGHLKLHTDARSERRLDSTATVFVKTTPRRQFVYFPFDVRCTNVEEVDPNQWHDVEFVYTDVPGHAVPHVYNSVAGPGDDPKFCTNITSLWRHLFTPGYQRAPGQTEFINRGLTGNIAIIIALIAMSCPRERLPEVLRNLRTHSPYTPHQYQAQASRGTPRQGVIVCIYPDPNYTHSSKQLLRDLAEGVKYGPFFRP